MPYWNENTGEFLIAPPTDLEGNIIGDWVLLNEKPESPQPPPPPDIEGFVKSQRSLVNKLIKHLNSLDLYLESDDLRGSWRVGNFADAIAQWNFLKDNFTAIITLDEITAFQNDLITHNIPVTLNPTTLELNGS